MPKGGRKPNDSQLNYLFPSETQNLTKNAPFGNLETPPMRVKLIAGRPYMVLEDGRNKNVTPREPPPAEQRISLNPRGFDPNKINTYPPNIYRGGADGPSSTFERSTTHRSSRRDIFSPHPVLPAIASQLDRRLPLTSMLPEKPLVLGPEELIELRQRLRDELTMFDPARFKDIYLDLTNIDRHLMGSCKYSDLSFCLLKHQACCNTNTLRLVAALYVDEADPSSINYEKVLSFIAGALREDPNNPDIKVSPRHAPPAHTDTHRSREPPRYSRDGPRRPQDGDEDEEQDWRRRHRIEEETEPKSGSQSQGMFYNPILHQVDDYSSGEKYPYGEKEVAKLLRLVEVQLQEDSQMLAMDQIWSMFRMADPSHRGRLSREQIKGISAACGIPLSDSLMNQLIDRCDISNGQFDWQQYLSFIERVQPVHTGLNIPESKKPKELMRQMPQPSSNWPLQETPVPAGGRFSKLNHHVSESQLTNDTRCAPPPNDPGRQTDEVAIRNLHEKLRSSEQQYQRERIELMKSNADRQSEKWFDRFMKLASAMYANDKAGLINYKHAKELIEFYNDNHSLHLPPSEIAKTLDDCSDGQGKVKVHEVLKQLGTPP